MGYNQEPTEEQKNNWNQDPESWIWGIFYYNPNDKRLFPPKKINQFGYTTNFANPHSVFALIILMITLIVIGTHLN
jgi:uncharacterized membrane protein